MNISTKVLATALLAAGSTFAMTANTLVYPDPSSTFETTSLSKLTIKFAEWTSEDFPTEQVLVLDENGTTVSTGAPDTNFNDYACYDVTFNPAVTTPGNYVMVIPENLDPAGNPEYRINVVLKEDDRPTCVPTSVTPEPGTALVQGTNDFNNIRVEFAGDPTGLESVNFDLIKLTAADGSIVETTTMGFYLSTDPGLSMTDGKPFFSFSFNDDAQLPSGKYTLTIPAGAIKSSRGTLETTLTYTWDYTKTLPDADPTPLTLTSGLFGKASGEYSNYAYTYTWIGDDAVPFTEGMTIGQLTGVKIAMYSGEESAPGSAFLLDFNHGHKTNTLVYTLANVTTNETMAYGNARKLDDGKFLIAWPSDTKLLEGNEYEFEFHAYSSEGYPRVEFGNGCKVKVNGGAEPYRYSSAQFVASAPADGGYIRTADDAKITIVFNAPVKARAELNEGFGMSSPLSCESKSGEEYDAVWFVTLSYSALKSNSANVAVYAVGQDDLVVYGESGFEDSANNMINFNIQVSQPRALLSTSDSHMAGFETLRFISENNGQDINHAWFGVPYITDKSGEKVAEAVQDYVTDEYGTSYPYKVTKSEGTGWDEKPFELEYKFEPAITTPGRYFVHLPDAMFNFGTEFESISSVPQEISVWVVEYVDVNYSVDNHTIALPKVEKGKTAELNLNVADNWKLESLMLNGEDVTENVTDGRYVTPALEDAANLAATFAYDGEVIIPSGMNDIVSDLNLRGWSENGKIYIAGLKAGQLLNVYTIGGSLMATMTIGSDDMVEINVPENEAYIVTVTEEGTTAALKILNK